MIEYHSGKIVTIPTTHFLGNIQKKYRFLVSQAASETGFNIYIGLPSVPAPYGSSLVGIYTTETRSLEKFWKRYNELKAEQ